MIVFIVPTGIGASIGGDAGDATPALKMMSQVSKKVITHPNVVNASAINEMPRNCLYVEGSQLDSFLNGDIDLWEPPHGNKVLAVINKPNDNYVYNIVSAARATCGLNVEIHELKEPLRMKAWLSNSGIADGDYSGTENLIRELLERDKNSPFDAVAILSAIDTDAKLSLNYFREGKVNPWGAIEARVSKLISSKLQKPVAHAPLDDESTINNNDLMYLPQNEIINPRKAAEAVSSNYGHCVLKGLQYAPRPVKPGKIKNSINWSEVTCLVTPSGCFGNPHTICKNKNIPIIAVEDNKTLENYRDHSFHYVSNYLEAAGLIAAWNSGVTKKSVLSN